MAATYIIIGSGQAVSSAFVLANPHFSLVVQVPSHAATWGAVRAEFASDSGGPYAPLWVAGATSAYVWVGAGPGVADIPRPPTPFCRVSVTNSTASVASFAIYETRH